MLIDQEVRSAMNSANGLTFMWTPAAGPDDFPAPTDCGRFEDNDTLHFLLLDHAGYFFRGFADDAVRHLVTKKP
ncbi:hypothetical protein CWR43_17320 [Rhizobium sullae]|uniref:Uncharacterized protein n=1 Tax=Rhizobium sullae TaxID=50338 RepID=A0A2N0D880_RHISU|nr:hypothetical protein CWR43_17320 [Rhizobium sullae]